MAKLLTTLAASARHATATCDARSFSLDLGNTHCPTLAPVESAATADACMQACCAEGDVCETWQFCETGKPCAHGFWPQPGAFAIGHDLDGWPKNTTIDLAQTACQANASCIGLTYHSSDRTPSNKTILHIYLKTSAEEPTLLDPSWSRHVKAAAGCYIGRLDDLCANSSEGWQSRALPLQFMNIKFTHFGYPNQPRFFYQCQGPGSGIFPGGDPTQGDCDDSGNATSEGGGTATYLRCHFAKPYPYLEPPKIQWTLRQVHDDGSFDSVLWLSVVRSKGGHWSLELDGKTEYVASSSFSGDDLLVDLQVPTNTSAPPWLWRLSSRAHVAGQGSTVGTRLGLLR